MFIRVVHRKGWDVEQVGQEGEVQTHNFAGRDDALDFARTFEPEWIELGEVVPATAEAPQHHRWTTLRRANDGSYVASGLAWGGRRP